MKRLPFLRVQKLVLGNLSGRTHAKIGDRRIDGAQPLSLLMPAASLGVGKTAPVVPSFALP